ncbi:phage portal protein [Ferviditalea candida]|uniref:Phage portal protein n=1 Tax=Ferviditalea candida TaxID=3108399 RepID=A0ABU5ZKN8_9BACL|nr:phage portal protein [Paenibacillaceae bacterium T2]
MNIIDRTIAAISPKWAVQRTAARRTLDILNYGYSEGGASGRKKSMRGWQTTAAGPKDDVDLNLSTLRARSRSLYMTAPIATAALKTNRTNVIGPGLRLKSRIDTDLLRMTPEEADKWERQVEREFNLWASKKQNCDALRLNDFYDMQGIAFLGTLMNGDAFALFKQSQPTPWMPYPLRIHLVEADRISTPWQDLTVAGTVEGKNKDNGNMITSGVEYDSTGAVVAYWICNLYPITTGLEAAKPRKWERIEAFGANTGRPNTLHIAEFERAEQRRGVPYLAPVIESLKQITRYTEAELMAAVISGMFTVFIKSNGPASDQPLGSMIPAQDQNTANNDQADYEMGTGAVNVLNPGEEIQIANPGRPNGNFDMFVNSLSKYIGSALDVPVELLLKSFQSSYSASRAALLEAWKMFRSRRQWMAKEFCQPIYEEWLSYAIASGRIKAPGYFLDPTIQQAWAKAEWHGPAPGQIDPSKEVEAAGKRIALGISTRERETIELVGGDFDQNVKQLAREKELMDQAGLSQDIPAQSPKASGEGGDYQQ